MQEMQLLACLGLLVLAALAGGFAWSAHRSGQMQQRYGGMLRRAERPRLFTVLLGLRATTVPLLVGLALAIGLGWLRLGR